MSKPTSREVGFSKSIQVQEEEERKKDWDDMSPTSKREAEKKRAERKKEKQREKEKRTSEAALTSGFDHGFANLASYNGFEAGEKED